MSWEGWEENGKLESIDNYFEKFWNEKEQAKYIAADTEGGIKTNWVFGKVRNNVLWIHVGGRELSHKEEKINDMWDRWYICRMEVMESWNTRVLFLEYHILYHMVSWK